MYLREFRENWVKEKAKRYSVKGNILDVGAKDGRHGAFFPGSKYEAVDMEPQSPEVRKGDARNLPYEAGTFDGLLLMEVLEHVTHPQRVLNECSRVLKQGGTMFFSAPYLVLPAHYDYWRFSDSGLRMLFERAGLSVVSEEKLGGMLGLQATWFETVATARTWGKIVWPFAWLFRALSRSEHDQTSYCSTFCVLKKTGKPTTDEF